MKKIVLVAALSIFTFAVYVNDSRANMDVDSNAIHSAAVADAGSFDVNNQPEIDNVVFKQNQSMWFCVNSCQECGGGSGPQACDGGWPSCQQFYICPSTWACQCTF